MTGRVDETGTLSDLQGHASEPRIGTPRAFGIVFACVFAAVATWPILHGGPVRLWAAAIAAAFLIVALSFPSVLSPLNRLWMGFGLLLGMIVSPIMLFLVYVIAVVPTGLIMRLRGKDPLHRRFDREAASYWVHRNPPGKPDETMARQF